MCSVLRMYMGVPYYFNPSAKKSIKMERSLFVDVIIISNEHDNNSDGNWDEEQCWKW